MVAEGRQGVKGEGNGHREVVRGCSPVRLVTVRRGERPGGEGDSEPVPLICRWKEFKSPNLMAFFSLGGGSRARLLRGRAGMGHVPQLH